MKLGGQIHKNIKSNTDVFLYFLVSQSKFEMGTSSIAAETRIDNLNAYLVYI